MASLHERLTEVRPTALGSIVYGALDAKEKRVLILPVPVAAEAIGAVGIVFWGDGQPSRESIEALIEYLQLTKDCLPQFKAVAQEPEKRVPDDRAPVSVDTSGGSEGAATAAEPTTDGAPDDRP